MDNYMEICVKNIESEIVTQYDCFMIETAQKPQRAILVSVCSANMTMERTNEYLSELAFLLETAGG